VTSVEFREVILFYCELLEADADRINAGNQAVLPCEQFLESSRTLAEAMVLFLPRWRRARQEHA
jgi:hypothetical protein